MSIDPQATYYDGTDSRGEHIEAIRVIEAFCDGSPHKAMAIKYLLRIGRKGDDGGRRDLEKLRVWLNEWEGALT